MAGQSRPNVAELFAAARAQHQSGHLGPAQSLYQQVLSADPAHFGSLYCLGILAIQAGQPRNAIDLLGRAVKRKDAPDTHYHLALALALDRRLADATSHYRRAIALKPDYAEAHMNLGNVLTEQGQRDEAATCYARVLALDPRSAIAHYNLANVLATLARPADAERHFREAVACQPGFAEAWNNLGNLLRESGRGEEAEQAFRRALGLRPDFADACNNLGVVLAARGAVDDAIAQYRQAVHLRPDLAAGHNNLGLALSRAGDSDVAIECFRRALASQPDGLDALHHLARELFARGDAAAAVGLLVPALDRNGSAETRSIFVHCARALDDDALGGVRGQVLRALRENWAPAGDLEQTCVRLIKRVPAMAACISAAQGRADENQSIGTADVSPIADDPLLCRLLVSGRVSDAEVERALTMARRQLLARGADAGGADHLPFFCALAQQCFLNEYVFAESAEEGEAVERLLGVLAEGLRGSEPLSLPAVIAVAAYRPLHSLAGAEGLLARSWPAPVEELLTMQVREPLSEQAIRAELPALTAIDDATSRAVQAQYEANPYPRWIMPAPVVKPLRIDDHLREKFPLAPFRPMRLADGPDVLIAGCGTGSHPIEAQREFLGARVLAIDLSRTSLAYAVRKTRALGLPIEYGQADLLALDRIDRDFDVIEACGSLHHLADPAEGWRVLLRRLKPGGVMRLGLYSRLARTDINAARAIIKERGYRGTADEIRRFREEVFAWPDGMPGKSVLQHGDFYSISGCRDLLFHVQEYQHDLAEVAAFIAQEHLRFLGFELDARVAREYGSANPDDAAMIDLERWCRFEISNPNIFIGMYEFWVQKPESGA